MSIPRIFLKAGKAGSAIGRHPWVQSFTIDRLESEISDGAEVKVCSHDERFIAYGLFNSKSNIRLRLYSWNEEHSITEYFLRSLVQSAIDYRKSGLGFVPGEASCRWIFSEADGLSGLVVDGFGPHLVVQITSVGLFQRREIILKTLEELLKPKSILLRMDQPILKSEGLGGQDPCQVIKGDVEETTIESLGLKYYVNLKGGQKTGFYLDQRDNRAEFEKWVKGRSVLDLFCFSGSFSFHAARGGASKVVGVDVSEDAIQLAKKNAELNGLGSISFWNSDAFEAIDKLAQDGTQFDIVTLDPPRFAPSKGSTEKALRHYYKLNLEALRVLAPGGILVTSSCSHQIKPHDFKAMVASATRKAGRPARILFQGSQAKDHPVHLSCSETEYLKCLMIVVD